MGVNNGPTFLNQVLTNVNDSFENSTAAYGVFGLNDTNVHPLPNFDPILLLSVHHQLVNLFGVHYTKTVVKGLIEKANLYFVIEFTAIGSKYGYSEPQFEDNNEVSIRSYAERWISDLDVDRSVQYLREHTESVKREPCRFNYLLTK